MKGKRILIDKSVTMDCCEERMKEMVKDYPCKILHTVMLPKESKHTHCGLEPCLRGYVYG